TWQMHSQLRTLRALPEDGKAICSLRGNDRERAFTQISEALAARLNLAPRRSVTTRSRVKQTTAAAAKPLRPRGHETLRVSVETLNGDLVLGNKIAANQTNRARKNR